MKNFNIKNAMIGLGAIMLYFVLSIVQTLPFDIVNIDINSIPNIVKTIYLIIYDIFVVCILLLIFNKTIKKDFEEILVKHKEYYSKYINVWLIGLMIMLLSNAFIVYILKNGISSNEEAIRNLFKMSPIYVYLSAVIFAPIAEELVFRRGIKNIVGDNIIFVLVSGILFGLLHVLTSMSSSIDILYLIPYSAIGISFAYMLYKTDNIFVSMGFHFLHNGILIGLQFIMLLFS